MGVYDFPPHLKRFHVLFGKFVFKNLWPLYLVTQSYLKVRKFWWNIIPEGISTVVFISTFGKGDCLVLGLPYALSCFLTACSKKHSELIGITSNVFPLPRLINCSKSTDTHLFLFSRTVPVFYVHQLSHSDQKSNLRAASMNAW